MVTFFSEEGPKRSMPAVAVAARSEFRLAAENRRSGSIARRDTYFNPVDLRTPSFQRCSKFDFEEESGAKERRVKFVAAPDDDFEW